jgi:hypothetical protein
MHSRNGAAISRRASRCGSKISDRQSRLESTFNGELTAIQKEAARACPQMTLVSSLRRQASVRRSWNLRSYGILQVAHCRRAAFSEMHLQRQGRLAAIECQRSPNAREHDLVQPRAWHRVTLHLLEQRSRPARISRSSQRAYAGPDRVLDFRLTARPVFAICTEPRRTNSCSTLRLQEKKMRLSVPTRRMRRLSASPPN